MPTNKRHKKDTKTFDEMSYDEQAKSINAMVHNIQLSILANNRKAFSLGRESPLPKRRSQLLRLIIRLDEENS
jgi:hypothetical protein